MLQFLQNWTPFLPIFLWEIHEILVVFLLTEKYIIYKELKGGIQIVPKKKRRDTNGTKE
jgi:hypothetical protein